MRYRRTGLRLPVEGIAKPKEESERDRVLDMGEIARVWKASELLGYPLGNYIRMLMLTGQRRSEVGAMRWGDIDKDGATWTLRAAGTKSDRAHLVPLSAPSTAILDAVPRLGPFVFTNRWRDFDRQLREGKAAARPVHGSDGRSARALDLA
jgi:integrase